MFKRVVFVFNPKSGSSFRIIKDLKKIKKYFAEKYPQIEYIECSLLSDEISTIIKQTEKDLCLFIACGGDGTVAAVAEKIFNYPNFFLSVMPYGTGNDFSRAIGIYEISKDLDKTVDVFVGNQVKTINFDLWGIEKKVFLNYLSVGYDAAVVDRFQRMRGKLPALFRRPLGNRVLYLISGFFHLFYGIPSGAVIMYGSQKVDISGHKTLLLGNINSYAGGKPLDNSVVYTDKQLNIFQVKRLWGMIRLVSGRGCESQNEKSDSFVLNLGYETMGQIDGEPYPFAKGVHRIELIGQVKVIGG